MNLLARLLGRTVMDSVLWLEIDELSAMLKSRSPPLVIDVRGPEEFTGPLGHIDAANNVPLDQIPAHTTTLLDEHRPLVLVCHTDRRSAVAAEHLRRSGGVDIAVLRGGMIAWRSQSMP